MKMEKKTSQDYMDDISGLNEEPFRKEISEINEFYNGCNIFITGGSGFMGKLLIEKYLRCCPGVKKIFVLMRPKKGKSVEERMKKLFDDQICDVLKRERPNFRNQIQIIAGDTGASDLGISVEDRRLLMDETHVVVHLAATVQFGEKLRSIVETNIRGAKLMVMLAKEMKNLKAYVHISTAYSHCTRKFIDEKFYPPPVNSDKILRLIELLDDAALEILTPTLIGEYPNTYVFSKAVAEHAVQIYGADIPICIVRPSMVTPTNTEPIAGWIDNLNGPTGFGLGIGLGLIRTMQIDEDKVADIIPADYATNTIIAAAWDTAKTWNEEKQNARLKGPENNCRRDPIIFNNVSSCQNPIIWDELLNLSYVHAKSIPSVMSIWYYFLIRNRKEWTHNVCMIFLHLLPGAIGDLVCVLMGRKQTFLKIYKKINKFGKVLSYFMTQEWKFKNDNVIKLWNKMNATDKVIYNADLTNLDWDEYIRKMIRGVRVFLIKDPMDTLVEARKRYFKLKIAHYTLVSLLYILVAWVTMKLLFLTSSSMMNVLQQST